MYFPLGGSTIRGVSKADEIVWSRLYLEGAALHVDIGRGQPIDLPVEETERRWQKTNPGWPIMHAVPAGVGRDQFMARDPANQVHLAYAPDVHSPQKPGCSLPLESRCVSLVMRISLMRGASGAP